MISFNIIKNISIKNKIIVIVLSITFLIHSIGFTFITIWDINRLKSQIQTGLVLNTKMVANNCVVPLTFGDDQQATEALSHLKNIEFIETGYLFDKKGKLFASYPDTLNENSILASQEKEEILLKDGYFYVKELVFYQNETYGTLYIKANSKPLTSAKRKIITTLILLSIVLDILTIILAIKFQKYISAPILKLKNHFDKISENHDFSAYIAKQSNDEVGSLYDGFNQLLRQINNRQAERNKAMKLLIESEKHNKILLDFSPIGLALCNMDGSHVEINTAYADIIGREVEETLKLTNWDITPEKYYDQEKIQLKKISKTGRYGPYEKEYIHKNGNLIPVNLFGIVLNKDGKQYIWSSVEDITERKKSEKEIYRLLENSEKSGRVLLSVLEDEKYARQEIKKLNENLESRVNERTQQLEYANKELEAFSYSVSHDLRAPLRHINGYIDMLLRHFPDSLPEKGLGYIDTIADSSRQMGMLIDDLLLFSRTGRQEIRKSLNEMSDIFDKALIISKSDTKDRSISWLIKKLPEVYCDTKLLIQVWINLLSNAIKFTSKNEKAVIEVGYEENEKDFVFCITDNGVGFDMKYSGKLFGVFQRLHSKSEYEGTGIGLANVQRIIIRHGGRIWADAKPDKGAAFYFTLPKKTEDKL